MRNMLTLLYHCYGMKEKTMVPLQLILPAHLLQDLHHRHHKSPVLYTNLKILGQVMEGKVVM